METLIYGQAGELTIDSHDKKLRTYFLGQLSQAESDLFEEEIARDAGLFEQAQIIERELVDDYLRGELSAGERAAFDEFYLNGDERQERLSTAESLWRVANEREVTSIVRDVRPVGFWSALNDWRIGFAALAAAMLLFVGLVYVALRSGASLEVVDQEHPGQPMIRIGKEREETPVTEIGSANDANNSTVQPSRNDVVNVPKETPTSIDRPSPVFASFTLVPGALRDEGEQSIRIRPNTTNVRLNLTLPKDPPRYNRYAAAVKTADGETVFTATNISSLSITLPANKLENRTYIVFLQGLTAPNASESVAEYTFRVRR